MADVLEFPATLEREWRAAEGNLRRIVGRVPHDPAELQHCIDQIKPAFLETARSLCIEVDPADPEAAVQAVNAWVSDLVQTLLVRLFIRELELYRLRGRGPQPSKLAAIETLTAGEVQP